LLTDFEDLERNGSCNMTEVNVSRSGADVVGGRQQNDDTDVTAQFNCFFHVKSMFQPVTFYNLYTSISIESQPLHKIQRQNAIRRNSKSVHGRMKCYIS